MSNSETSTKQTFADKWKNNPDLAFQETLKAGSDINNWIMQRNGWSNPENFRAFLSGKKRLLDAGCGNGRVTALLKQHAEPAAEIVGIDLTSTAVARDNLDGLGVQIFEKNLLDDLKDLGTFDFIYCQEVLHHTSDPRRAFRNLCNILAPCGEIAVYVYKKKAPVREFVDDYVRERMSAMDYETAMQECREIAKLGQVLSELNVTVTVPDLPILEIKGGTYDTQRFFYHYFMKCFWNPSLSPEANAVINYDWYHPQLCSRHSQSEVEDWFRDASLEIIWSHTDFYGITVRGCRK